jgi:hypothetical protein
VFKRENLMKVVISIAAVVLSVTAASARDRSYHYVHAWLSSTSGQTVCMARNRGSRAIYAEFRITPPNDGTASAYFDGGETHAVHTWLPGERRTSCRLRSSEYRSRLF